MEGFSAVNLHVRYAWVAWGQLFRHESSLLQGQSTCVSCWHCLGRWARRHRAGTGMPYAQHVETFILWDTVHDRTGLEGILESGLIIAITLNNYIIKVLFKSLLPVPKLHAGRELCPPSPPAAVSLMCHTSAELFVRMVTLVPTQPATYLQLLTDYNCSICTAAWQAPGRRRIFSELVVGLQRVSSSTWIIALRNLPGCTLNFFAELLFYSILFFF